MLKPSLDLFLAALIVGLGFGLGYAFITWLFGKIVEILSRHLDG